MKKIMIILMIAFNLVFANNINKNRALDLFIDARSVAIEEFRYHFFNSLNEGALEEIYTQKVLKNEMYLFGFGWNGHYYSKDFINKPFKVSRLIYKICLNSKKYEKLVSTETIKGQRFSIIISKNEEVDDE